MKPREYEIDGVSFMAEHHTTDSVVGIPYWTIRPRGEYDIWGTCVPLPNGNFVVYFGGRELGTARTIRNGIEQMIAAKH